MKTGLFLFVYFLATPHQTTYGILVSWPGIELGPPQGNHWVLTSGLPGNFPKNRLTFTYAKYCLWLRNCLQTNTNDLCSTFKFVCCTSSSYMLILKKKANFFTFPINYLFSSKIWRALFHLSCFLIHYKIIITEEISERSILPDVN